MSRRVLSSTILITLMFTMVINIPASASKSVSPSTYTSCAGQSSAGKNQDQTFFSGVLGYMGIQDSQFARSAFMAWKAKENTNACWNPLATTYQVVWMPGSGCTETIFNSIGVRNYSSKECGQLATAKTLLYTTACGRDCYKPIRNMLSQVSFNWQAIHDSLKIWVGSDAYATDLTNQWQTLWNNRGGGGFVSGWENGQINGYQNWVLYSKSVAGYYNSSNPPPEAGKVTLESWATPNMAPNGGSYYLRVAGYSQASYSYVYFNLFDTNIKIESGMKLRYYIYAYQGQTFAIDGHFTDGNTIRDFNNNGYLTDQNGRRIHPAYQGAYGTGYWRYVEVDLSKAAGRTLDYLMVAFDNGNNGFTGQFRAYVDNVSIGK